MLKKETPYGLIEQILADISPAEWSRIAEENELSERWKTWQNKKKRSEGLRYLLFYRALADRIQNQKPVLILGRTLSAGKADQGLLDVTALYAQYHDLPAPPPNPNRKLIHKALQGLSAKALWQVGADNNVLQIAWDKWRYMSGAYRTFHLGHALLARLDQGHSITVQGKTVSPAQSASNDGKGEAIQDEDNAKDAWTESHQANPEERAAQQTARPRSSAQQGREYAQDTMTRLRSRKETIKLFLNSIFRRDPAARNKAEILLTYPGITALAMHRLCYRLWQWRWMRIPARMLSNISRLLTGIEIHPRARIGRRLFIDHGMGVVIGETAEIGDDVTLYQGVTLGGLSWNEGKRHPTLGNHVVVGAGAKILGPIHIGDGAKIGSNAVVVKDVPAAATALGVPAHIIEERPMQKEDSQQGITRRKTAERIGFSAYGLSDGNMPDPVINAINAMLDHIHQTDKRMDEMCHALRIMGSNLSDDQLPDLSLLEVDCLEIRRPQNKQEKKAR